MLDQGECQIRENFGSIRELSDYRENVELERCRIRENVRSIREFSD